MFYISFVKESMAKNEAQAAPENRRYIAVPEWFVWYRTLVDMIMTQTKSAMKNKTALRLSY